MTKQLTRQEVEAVVERLADKTLSFGCMITVDGKHNLKVYQYNADQNIVHAMGDSGYSHEIDLSKYYKILWHPITIGNVLDKIQNRNDFYPCYRFDLQGYLIEIVQLWQPLGLSRSLQEIISESGYESRYSTEVTITYPVTLSPTSQIVEVLTSPEANALFSFLYEIL